MAPPVAKKRPTAPAPTKSAKSAPAEAPEKASKGPSAKGLNCLCGCGQPTVTDSARFIPGHDAKLKALLQRVERGEEPKSAIPEEAKPFLQRSTMSKAWMFPHESGITPDERKHGKPYAEVKDEIEAQKAEKAAAKKERLAALKNKKTKSAKKARKVVEEEQEDDEDEEETEE